jgi:hypothetical protein
MLQRPLFFALLVPALMAGSVRAADVVIYRCVDAKGKLALRDTPCAKGEKQETRTMQRPQDAPPRPAPAPAVVRDEPPQPQRVVTVYPARAMYECTTPDGDRYTSDSSAGNPRWVPLWTLDYPVYRAHPRTQAGVDFRIAGPHVDITGGSHIQSGSGLSPAAYGAGTWIRDACYALPPAEACDRLVDRRDEIRRRFFNAQPSERDVLRLEERGINARLSNDCGIN